MNTSWEGFPVFFVLHGYGFRIAPLDGKAQGCKKKKINAMISFFLYFY